MHAFINPRENTMSFIENFVDFFNPMNGIKILMGHSDKMRYEVERNIGGFKYMETVDARDDPVFTAFRVTNAAIITAGMAVGAAKMVNDCTKDSKKEMTERDVTEVLSKKNEEVLESIGKTHETAISFVSESERDKWFHEYEKIVGDPIEKTFEASEYALENMEKALAMLSKEEYQAAKEKAFEAVGHTLGIAGTIIEMPPVGLFEIFMASRAIKESAKHYTNALMYDPTVPTELLTPLEAACGLSNNHSTSTYKND